MRKLVAIIPCLFLSISALGQSSFFPLNSRSENLIERWEIQSGHHFQSIGTHIKPFSRTGNAYLDGLSKELQQIVDSQGSGFSSVDQYQFRYLSENNAPYFDELGFVDTQRKGLWNTFYERKRHFYSHNVHNQEGEGWSIYVKPIIDFSVGQSSEKDNFLYRNTRGIKVRGDVDRKVGFQFSLTENQARYPAYIDNYVGAYKVVPGIGFMKSYGEDAYDFFNASGSIAFRATRHIQLQFGHGDHFIGQGKRSMLLSDFGPNYLFLRVMTNVGKINYQNIFTEFIQGNSSTQPRQKKYGAFHHLSVDILPNLQWGVFEGVIMHDNRGTGRNFELNYLNPVIFYRAVDHHLGSPDNILIGSDVDYIPFKGVQLYGQLLFDEFVIDELRGGNGSWRNKYSWQLGGKYLDAFGINQLDFQVEYNEARPFTYSHLYPANSYTHYNQPLAHPLGANFREALAEVSYQPFKKWKATLTLAWSEFGKDSQKDTFSMGGNPRISYENREKDFGNVIGQGVKNIMKFANLKLSYEAFPNLYLDLEGRIRKVNSENNSMDMEEMMLFGGLRYNFHKKPEIF